MFIQCAFDKVDQTTNTSLYHRTGQQFFPCLCIADLVVYKAHGLSTWSHSFAHLRPEQILLDIHVLLILTLLSVK